MAKAKNFIPQLSPQKLRLLRKIFVTNQHSKDLLVKTLEMLNMQKKYD